MHALFKTFLQDETTREARIVCGLNWTVFGLLVAIGFKSWHSGHILHGNMLLLFSLVPLASLLHYHRNKDALLLKNSLISMVAILFAYLVASGGESNTGPLWFYVFPPLAFYMTNLRTGLALSLLCLSFAVVVFRLPDLPMIAARYETDFQLRFLATLTFEIVFCYVTDYERRRARQTLMEVANLHDKAARTDELTGLSNRRDMQQHLAMELSRYQRSGHHFSVVLIDLDHFKRINDVYSHEAGDKVLSGFARIAQSICRQSDIAARWGGEEFLLLLPDTSLLQALSLAERLRVAVDAHAFVHDGQRMPVTLSAGVCSITQFNGVEQLLSQADIYLYEAKMSGRNLIVPRVRKAASEQLTIVR